MLQRLDVYSRKTNVDLGELNKWYDLGHRNSYFKHRLENVLSRSFNRLHVYENYLIKESSNIDKICAEFNWYKHVPIKLSMHTPKLATKLEKHANSAHYGIETIPSFSLSELFVYGNNNEKFWKKMFHHLKTLLTCFYHEGDDCRVRAINNKELSDVHFSLYLGKTLNRLTTYKALSGEDISEHIEMVTVVNKYIL